MRASLFVLVSVVLPSVALAQVPDHRLLAAPVLNGNGNADTRLLADVDNDGDVDLLRFVGLGNSGLYTSCFVDENDGTGRFTVGVSNPLSFGSGPHVAVGDVDGDGLLDLLVSATGGHPQGFGLLVLRGLPAAQFAAPLHVPLPGDVQAFGTGNANGDAIDDILVAHWTAVGGSEARWLLGEPTLTFPLFATGGLTIAPMFGFTIVDADADGQSDFAFADYSGSPVLRLLRTAPPGFATHATVPLPNDLSRGLVAADFDLDGDVDIVSRSVPSPGTLTLTRCDNVAGVTWTLGNSQNLNGVPDLASFAGDLDGDGDPDLVVRDSSTAFGHTIRLLRNSAGVFTARRSANVPTQANGPGAGCADLDGDGKLDFVDARALWFGTGTTDPQLQQSTSRTLDLERDGDLDQLLRPNLGRNDGSGALAVFPCWPAPPATNRFYSDVVATGDFDGDGHTEVLVPLLEQNPPALPTVVQMRRLVRDADDQLVDIGAAAAPGVAIPESFAADADGDGDVDLLVVDGIWQNDGTGSFVLQPQNFQSRRPIANGDVDGDGDLDLLAVGGIGQAEVAVLYHIGGGVYVPVTLTSGTAVIVGGASAAFADLDGDGDLDIVGSERIGTGPLQVRVFENTAGAFSPATTIGIAGPTLVGDLDADGTPEILVQATDRLHLLRRTGPGLGYGGTVVYSIRTALRLGDLDQDGDPDLLGSVTEWNRRFEQPDAGASRQYGVGGLGAGGYRPLLSVVGPLRPGFVADLRIGDGLGAAPAAIFFSAVQADIPNVLPGVTAYIATLDLATTVLLSGVAAAPGQGRADFLLPLAGLGGIDVFFQAAMLDASAPSGVVHSNGCEMRVGF